MGIREYFKERTEEETKFQDFRFQEAEKGTKIKFNVETEITEQDWEEMVRELEGARNNESWWAFAQIVMSIKILQPEKAAELNIEQSWPGMKQELEGHRNKNWWDFADLAAHMKILQPNKAAELNIEEAWPGMMQTLEGYRNTNWWGFTYLAMCMKIFQPEKAAELNLDQAWSGMIQELKKYRNTDWWTFADLAMHMKILAAYKVKITDQGLEVTMRPSESFKQTKTPRPKRKTF